MSHPLHGMATTGDALTLAELQSLRALDGPVPPSVEIPAAHAEKLIAMRLAGHGRLVAASHAARSPLAGPAVLGLCGALLMIGFLLSACEPGHVEVAVPDPASPDELASERESQEQALRLDERQQEAGRIEVAARQGDAEAQFNLGTMYANGDGVAADRQEAILWWRLAAAQGHAWALVRLGDSYRLGLGVPRDDAEAARWYQQAAERFRVTAEQGDAEAQYDLGSLYATGQVVPRDDREAARWVTRSAAQGHAPALYGLGGVYEGGRGVARDPVVAYALFGAYLAITTDGPSHRVRAQTWRSMLAPDMPAEELARAEALAVRWTSDPGLIAADLSISP